MSTETNAPFLSVTLRDGVDIADGCDISNSYLEHVSIGPGCIIHGCHIQGTADAPVAIAADVELRQAEIASFPSDASFSFGTAAVGAAPVSIGPGTRLFGARIENSTLGAKVEGKRCHVLNSVVGDKVKLRPHGSLTLVHAGSGCNLGSEVSKSLLLGEGFTSEHTASYLSLVAPSAYPILDGDGQEVLLEGLPNLTNIGAGTVFANYSGKPKGAPSLEASSGSLKGTAVAYGAFTAVNCVIVNRYGKVTADETPFSWLRRSDLTILGLGCFVEGKVTGRIPAFSYAGGTGPDDIKPGWVLEKHPGIVLNIIKKMRSKCSDPSVMADLLEGTIRLELQLLREQQKIEHSFYSPGVLDDAIALFSQHLDGRWAIGDDGHLQAPWRYDEATRRWCPA